MPLPSLAINGKFLSQPPSGVQRYARQLIKALDKKLQAQDKVTLYIPSDSHQVPRLENISIVRTPYKAHFLWEQWHLPQLVKEEVLLCLGNTAPLLGNTKKYILIHDMGVVDTPHAYTLKFRWWYRLLWSVLKRKAHILTVSQFSSSRIQTHFKLPSPPPVVSCGVDHLFHISNKQSSEGDISLPSSFFLFVGNHNPNKNLSTLLKAYSLMPPNKPDLVIVGAENSKIFQPATACDQTQIHFLGSCDDQQLQTLFKKAQGFVFPSLYEGFGLPPFEALLLGCPVLVSKTHPAVELLSPYTLVCDPTSPTDMSQQLMQLAKQNRLHFSLLPPHFPTWEHAAETLYSILCASP